MKNTLLTLGLASTLTTGGLLGADRAINPYEDRTTHFELPIQAEISQGERVEIAKDRAEITLRGWNDEYAISVIPQIPTANSRTRGVRRDFEIQSERPLLSQRMEYRQGNITTFIEPKEGTLNEFDIDFTLESRPDTNVFEYAIEGAEEFDFFYQPALTQQEIEEGAERPENVVGSYAVYHKTKANHKVGSTNYATGKVLHIYRPKAIDANGAEEWAILNYDNGVLGVEVPQDFLDKAVYPVVVDPTFGTTSLGASHIISYATYASDTSTMVGQVYTLSEDGILDSISIGMGHYFGGPVIQNGSDSVDIFGAIYDQDSGGAGSHDLIASVESLEETISTAAFHTITASSESLSADTYIIAGLANGEDMVNSGHIISARGDTGSSLDTAIESSTGAGSYSTRKSEDPWTETLSSTSLISIYATYTASAVEKSGVLNIGSGSLEIGAGTLEITN